MSNNLLTINAITREAVQMFAQSNSFLANVEYDCFEPMIETLAPVALPLALAAGAAAAVMRNPSTTRRGLLAWLRAS